MDALKDILKDLTVVKERLVLYAAENEKYNRIEMMKDFIDMAIEIGKNAEVSYLQGSSVKANIVEKSFIDKLNKYIDSQLANENLDVPMIISHMAMSKAALYLKAREYIGMGLMEYVNKLRMITAAHKLLRTDLKVSEIAVCVGINDQKSFSKKFKVYFHETPTNYRINHNSK